MTAIISDEDEVLDLVDENDQVVGSITHDKVFDEANLQGRYLRASNVFIINSAGKMWIPQRSATKKLAPNGLDYSAGEHVASGESYQAAIIRGMAEELGITVDPTQLTLAYMTKPRLGITPYFDATYLYFSDEVPRFNTDDFVSYEWLAPAELIQKLDAGVAAKPSLRSSVMLYLDYLAEHKRNQQRNQ